MKLFTKSRQKLRRYFPNEFSWRLYVVVQFAVLIAFGSFLLSESGDGRPLFTLNYRTVYEDVEVRPAEIDAARARCSHLSDDPNHPDARPPRFVDPFEPDKKLSSRELCFLREKPKSYRAVGSELAGIRRINGQLVAALLGAFLGPLLAFRVVLWVVDGWRRR